MRDYQKDAEKRILSLGSINRDVIYFVPHIARPGETVHSTGVRCGLGGKGLNQAVAAAKSGADAWFAGRCGSDGADIAEEISRQGVNCTHLHRGSGRTGEAHIQVTPAGENAIILVPGENFCFTKDYVISVLDCFDRGDMIILQNEINLIPFIMEEACRRGMHIIFNPAPCTPETSRYPLELVHTMVLNEGEARMLDPNGPEEIEKLILRIASLCPASVVVITLGEHGALWVCDKEVRKVLPFQTEVVDTTCAGDTFIGFYAGSLMRGYAREEALAAASQAASLCVSRIGAIPAIPTWEELVR